jgi:hypothetical protein
MEHPNLTGTAGVPGNGPFMILSLRVQEGRITAAKFRTYGCGSTIATGSMLTGMIIGRTIGECRELTAEELIGALDGMPPDKLHGPALQRAPGTLYPILVGTRATRRSHVMVRMLRAVVSLAGADLHGERVRTFTTFTDLRVSDEVVPCLTGGARGTGAGGIDHGVPGALHLLTEAHSFYERLGYEATSLRFKKSLSPP